MVEAVDAPGFHAIPHAKKGLAAQRRHGLVHDALTFLLVGFRAGAVTCDGGYQQRCPQYSHGFLLRSSGFNPEFNLVDCTIRSAYLRPFCVMVMRLGILMPSTSAKDSYISSMVDGGPPMLTEAYSILAGMPVFSSRNSRTVLPLPSVISSEPSSMDFTVRPARRSLSNREK